MAHGETEEEGDQMAANKFITKPGRAPGATDPSQSQGKLLLLYFLPQRKQDFCGNSNACSCFVIAPISEMFE